MFELKFDLRKKKAGKQSERLLDEHFVRRDYDMIETYRLSVGSRKRDLKTSITKIEFLVVQPTNRDNEIPIEIYRNLSPEYWEFTKMFMMYNVGNCNRLVFRSAQNVDLEIVIGGTTK